MDILYFIHFPILITNQAGVISPAQLDLATENSSLPISRFNNNRGSIVVKSRNRWLVDVWFKDLLKVDEHVVE